jgi:hypothetical protein
MSEVSELVAKFFGLPASVVQKPVGPFLSPFGPRTARYLALVVEWSGLGTRFTIKLRDRGDVARFFLRRNDTANWNEPWAVIQEKFMSGEYTGYKQVEFDPATDTEKRLTATAILIEHLCKGDRT